MPEGPSIVILKEAVQQFRGQKIIAIEGNTRVDFSSLLHKKITGFRSFGKNFFICFGKRLSIKIHFMLFGTYRINEDREATPRLQLIFKHGYMNFYACSVKLIQGDLDEMYDWTADVMNESWNPRAAIKKLKKIPEALVVDALLDQEIFAGVGNIIKNEVLFRIRIHPQSHIGSLPQKKLNELVKETRLYCFDFLQWKKQYVLKKNWQVHTKKICPRDGHSLFKEYLGKTNRRTFFCPHCQELYT